MALLSSREVWNLLRLGDPEYALKEKVRCENKECVHVYDVHSIMGGSCHVTRCSCEQFAWLEEVQEDVSSD